MVKKTTCAVLLAGIMLLQACSDKKNTESHQDHFPVTRVIRVDTSTYTDYVTEIHALQNVDIRARVSGYLEKIHVDEGASVHEGQLLFSINNKEYAEELAKARALYKSAVAEANAAELELSNVMQLADKKIISAAEVLLAKNKLESQKAKMEEALAEQTHAQLRFSNTEIRAPFTGVINRIPHRIGSLIDEGTLLTSISQNDEVYAYFDVSEKEYLAYARNLKKDSAESRLVSLILADGSEHPCKGRIETIEGVIDAGTGNIAFRAKFKNPDRIIKHGASGKIRLRKAYDDVLVVPQKSTFEIQDKLYVFVVDDNNTVQMRNIEARYRMPHLFIVNKGVSENERIIYEGVQNLRAGMTVNPKPLAMRQIIKELALR